jgi:endonuclease-3
MDQLIKNNGDRVLKIREVFDMVYGDAECSLRYQEPLQLLIATQLAAQCTDARVNIVTKDLFEKYKNAHDFANAALSELEQEIKSTGFYRNKAKNIINCCKTIIDKFDGKVPSNLEDLLTLPGVGRKTANLVLGDIFGVPGLVIDTHAKRLSHRIGLTINTDPTKIEYDLMDIVSSDYWSKFCHQLVYHGRAICVSRKPKCHICPINQLCEYSINLKLI